MADFTLQWQTRSFTETIWSTNVFTRWTFTVCRPDIGKQIEENPQSCDSGLAQSTAVLTILYVERPKCPETRQAF